MPLAGARVDSHLLIAAGLMGIAIAAALRAAGAEPDAANLAAAAALVAPEDRYGVWTLTPALAAIVLAVVLRQVFPALILGIVTAAWMMMPCLPAEAKYGGADGLVTAVRLAIERYLIGALLDPSHTGELDPSRVQTVLFTLTIAGMVGVLHANGGTAAFVRIVARLASTRRRGQLATFGAGLAIFFDDYSNCMIIGPTMRPMLDRLRISREKLSFILDATAAPVASVALVGTWVAAEVNFIETGLKQLSTTGGRPAFLEGVTAYTAFIQSLPYRFYAIFALVLVFLIALSGRDFGPMRKAEVRAQREPLDEEAGAEARRVEGRWWYAGVPVIALIVSTLAILYLSGRQGAGPEAGLAEVLSNANAYVSILYGATIAINVALAVSLATGSLRLGRAIESMMEGAQRILPAVVVLIFAWALSDAMKDLHLGLVAVRELQAHAFSPHLLPLLIFASACVVSFATGTSWGTMGILCPVAILLGANLGAELPKAEALTLFYATVGSVLAGAVFGDHCSPISDTTVLSALASSCPLEAHVWTQWPYAVTAAVMEVLAGDLLCGYFGLPVWAGLAAGAAGLVIVVYVAGRPLPTAETAFAAGRVAARAG